MTLPSSIEASLLEAGFTGTELLILKRLLEEDALTLRTLALKTGKSVGVLDQAMKKLIKKGVTGKKDINGTPHYTLDSLQSIIMWMEKDTRLKQEQLKRRHENFESFISSVSLDRARPDMQHFHGEKGIKQAYEQLLLLGKELLVYMPVTMKEEEDPLREFRVQHFRMRRQKEIFSRVIAHDTPLGRRYQSRDPFEYRKTLLIDPAATPIPFEKIIVGNTVACFDHQKQSACFMKFPELADAERSMFEAIWSGAKREAVLAEMPEGEYVPLKTRLMSQIREFSLSRHSFYALGVIAVLSVVITFGVYRASITSQRERIREKVMSIAATGALQFSVDEIKNLRTLKDIYRPEYAAVIERMRAIRNQNKDVIWIYIFRSMPGRNLVEFVADADSLDPYLSVDINYDGEINEADESIVPGFVYDTTHEGIDFANAEMPTASPFPYTDQWGTFISGYAVIGYNDGEKYFLGVDVSANKVNQSAISWILLTAFFAGCFLSLTLLYVFFIIGLLRFISGFS